MAKLGTLIKKLPDREWLVPSQSDDGAYRVKAPRPSIGRVSWVCTCKDHLNRGQDCKHIHAIKLILAVQEPVQQALPEARVMVAAKAAPEGVSCKHCRGVEVTRYGVSGKKPAYWCKPCQRKFVVDDGFKRLKGDPKTVTLALDLYFKGVSLRQIADTLEQFFEVKVGHVTIYNWLNRYVRLLNAYAATLRPEVGTAKWHADEMKVKFGADWRWLWHVMDRQTRYLLVSKVTVSRELADAKAVFTAARTQADGATPQVVVTDGLPAYMDAARKVFNTGRQRDAKHEREIHLTNQKANNNMVERLNSTVRGRQKPARGLKSPKGPLTKGQAAYYNLIRPHAALDGKTPAQAAGLPVAAEGNRWKAAIDAATKKEEPDATA